MTTPEHPNGDSFVPTPGPWHAYFNMHGDPFVVTDPDRPGFSGVATVHTSPEDYGRANTLLLAAAPDLLAAAEVAVKAGNHPDHCPASYGPMHRCDCGWRPAEKALIEAIAAAKNGTTLDTESPT